MRSLGLAEWAAIAGIVASLAAVAAFVVPTADDQSSATGDRCDDAVAWDQAAESDGALVLVRGPVVSATYAAGTDTRPTYLNLGRDYPDPERFTVVIFGESRGNFNTPPEEAYDGLEIAVSGEVTSYREVRQIVANHPNDIVLC